MLRHSYDSFLSHPDIEDIYVVIGEEQREFAEQVFGNQAETKFVTGGTTRRESVLNGLCAIATDGGARYVLIHDAARPFLSSIVISELITALSNFPGAVPVLPIVDSLARGDSIMEETVERDGLWKIQTPQAFHFESILSAHNQWNKALEASDDARILMSSGHEVVMIEGDESLAKYTFPSDFSSTVGSANIMSDLRTGSGYDVHRLVAGKELWLCGVKIDHPSGLSGHSDADVAIHALTDAILGALALGDIGDHFPPSDPKWRGASSDQFLTHAIELVGAKGYVITNVDVTIICEAPKIGPYRTQMRQRLAQIMGVDLDRVSVKATTTERLGYTGRGEGIAAHAIATVVKSGATQ